MRRKLVFLLASLSLATAVHAQTFREWQDPGVNAVNRAPMHTHYFAYENEGLALAGCPESSANYLSVGGDWKFNWVADADLRPT